MPGGVVANEAEMKPDGLIARCGKRGLALIIMLGGTAMPRCLSAPLAERPKRLAADSHLIIILAVSDGSFLSINRNGSGRRVTGNICYAVAHLEPGHL